jgi:hypothetical protein
MHTTTINNNKDNSSNTESAWNKTIPKAVVRDARGSRAA